MTLYELSLEYDRSSALLRERIVQLERVQRQEQDEQRRLQLAGRIRPLRAMYRETRAVYRHLEGYCQKFTLNSTEHQSVIQ